MQIFSKFISENVYLRLLSDANGRAIAKNRSSVRDTSSIDDR